MLAWKSLKTLVIFIVLTSLFSACGWWKSLTDSATPTPTPFTAQEIPSSIPFQTKEPENYQAEFVVSNFSGEEKSVKKIFVARDGIKHFITFNAGEKSAFSNLDAGNGGVYLISAEKKIFTEESPSSDPADENEESLKDFLMTEWLNEKTSASFEKLGTENNLTTFRTNLDSAKNTEILLYVDENLQFPVKQEFYSLSAGERKMMFSAEILNFKTPADTIFFELPADYRKVSRKEFDKIIYQDK